MKSVLAIGDEDLTAKFANYRALIKHHCT